MENLKLYISYVMMDTAVPSFMLHGIHLVENKRSPWLHTHKILTCVSKRLVCSVMVCLVDAAARYDSNSRICCFSSAAICSSLAFVSSTCSPIAIVGGGYVKWLNMKIHIVLNKVWSVYLNYLQGTHIWITPGLQLLAPLNYTHISMYSSYHGARIAQSVLWWAEQPGVQSRCIWHCIQFADILCIRNTLETNLTKKFWKYTHIPSSLIISLLHYE